MERLNRNLTLLLLLGFFTSTAQLAYMDSSLEDEFLIVNDVLAPSTDLLRTEKDDFIFGPATRIKFKILEEESGLKATYFKIGSLPFMKSNGQQMVPYGLEDGEYTIRYYSIDNSGNQEQIRMDKIYLDRNGPTITSGFSITPSAIKDGLPVFSEDVKLVVEAEDAKVDLQKLTYQINDGPIIETSSSGGISFVGIDGVVKVEICAYDTFYNLTKETVELVIKK